MQPIPSVIAILLCDRIIVEAGTGKKSIIGIFDSVNVPKLPWGWPFGFYARITDSEGEYRFRIDVVCANESRQISKIELEPVDVNNRLGFIELVLNLPPIVIDRLGRYEFQLYANDVFIGHVTLDVKSARGEQQ